MKRNYILMAVNTILVVVLLVVVWQLAVPDPVLAYDDTCDNTCGSNKCNPGQYTVDIMEFDGNHDCKWVGYECHDSCPAECDCGEDDPPPQ